MAEYNSANGHAAGVTMKKRNRREGEVGGLAGEDAENFDEKAYSVERAFDGKPVPPWQQQLTFRAFVVSFFLGIMFSVIVMKLNLTTGVIPSLNVSAGLLGFFFVKIWSKALEKTGLLRQPFTRQENTVIQTCVVASSGIAFSERCGEHQGPQVGWMIGFLFVVSFLGLFSLVPLRKIMIIDYKLIYPSGTATAHLINSFHTPQGAKLAKKQVSLLGKFFSFSFLWGFFQWFYTAGDDCGFINFPTFGLQAYKNRFYFDFSATYVGVGMICPYLVNISVLLGGILSWGLMWPLIEKREGDWYPAGTSPSSLHGIQGYRIFIAIALILGDGLYNFIRVIGKSGSAFVEQVQRKRNSTLPMSEEGNSGDSAPVVSFDEQRRTELFLRDQIPLWLACGGYVLIAIVSIITLPHIFPPLKWYYVLVAYIFAPVLAFCNAYGCGLTDWSLASTYGKLAIFVIGAWAGAGAGGVIASLAACGVMMSIVSTASDLMQDFKTGYLTLASPRSMFISQVIGTAMGCVISPCGFGSLPKNCLTLCYVFFAAGIFVNLLRDVSGKKVARFIPIPMAMAIPFYLGPYFAIDMCVGSLILFVWERTNKAKADAFAPAVASGLICGDGIWTLPQSILALAKVKPPICMKFLSRAANVKVDNLLSS
ncbi:unnamed protein product [Spirodela intermedia]|uniref:Uncharacterized protein n=1 Tax=Spirodela intermedia TaxID=51605 RepID=A0A7I8IFW4_SPIIN|nr:unnamed protein product [Spirodela intermedia]CAA6655762.1 unnamed protein product [Spirodela intermedia]